MQEGTYLITGINGFIGKEIVKKIRNSYEYLKNKIKLIFIVRDVNSISKEILKDKNIVLYKYSVVMEINEDIDYIIHTAGTTKKDIIKNVPIDVLENDINMMFTIIRIAKTKSIRSMVFLSSAQVYQSVCGKIKDTDELIDELAFEDIDAYSESKKMCEILCNLHAKQSEGIINIIRLFSVYGPGDNLNRGTFLTQFMKKAISNEDIEIEGYGDEVRNLCYIDDIVSAIFFVLFNSKKSECFNVGGENATILDIAKYISDLNKDISVIIKGNETNSNVIKYQKPNLDKIHKLGWSHTVSIKNGLEKMYNSYLKN